MFIVRNLFLLVLKLLRRFSSATDPGNPAETGVLGEPIGNSWWYQQAGSVQVHIRSDPDLHWEIFIWDPAANVRVTKSTFRPNLKEAFDLAVHLQKHYSANPSTASSHPPIEMAHG